MYEELVQALRVCGDTETDGCYDCKHKTPCMTCNQLLMLQAADAIEELSKRVPAVPHGRLIDADALCDLCNNSKLKFVDANDIMRMPTIIPASGGAE